MSTHPERPPVPPEMPSGGVPGRSDRPGTYQEALDEALAETFPASDPISPSSVDSGRPPKPSLRDAVDWPLKVSSTEQAPPAEPPSADHPPAPPGRRNA